MEDMAPLYETLAASAVLELDQKVLDSMHVKIAEELKKLDKDCVFSKSRLGDCRLNFAVLVLSCKQHYSNRCWGHKQ